MPPKYHDFLGVLSREGTKLMPPHRLNDYTNDLEIVQTPPHSHTYLLQGMGLNILQEFLGGILGKGFICTSSSPGGAPALFAKGKGGAFRLCGNFGTSTSSLKRIPGPYQWSQNPLTSLAQLNSTPSQTCVQGITLSTLFRVMSGT